MAEDLVHKTQGRTWEETLVDPSWIDPSPGGVILRGTLFFPWEVPTSPEVTTDD